MSIRSFEFDAEASRAGIRLRQRLRGDDPLLPVLLDRSLPFYRHPDNAHRHFQAYRGGELVGQVTALIHHGMKDRDGAPVGALGLFDCVEDEDAAGELLAAALGWLDERGHGGRVWAPIDFDIWHGYRFRTRGFHCATFRGEPDNPPYYPALLTRHGFTVRKTWRSVEVVGEAELREWAASGAERHRQRLADGYRFRTVAPCDLEALHAVTMASFAGFLGFTELPLAEFRALHGAALQHADPGLMTLVLDPRGEVIGFSIAFPEAERNRAIYYMIGITPQEVARRHGLGRAAFFDTMQRIQAAGHQRVVLALLGDDSGARSLAGPWLDGEGSECALFEKRR